MNLVAIVPIVLTGCFCLTLAAVTNCKYPNNDLTFQCRGADVCCDYKCCPPTADTGFKWWYGLLIAAGIGILIGGAYGMYRCVCSQQNLPPPANAARSNNGVPNYAYQNDAGQPGNIAVINDAQFQRQRWAPNPAYRGEVP